MDDSNPAEKFASSILKAAENASQSLVVCVSCLPGVGKSLNSTLLLLSLYLDEETVEVRCYSLNDLDLIPNFMGLKPGLTLN